MSTVPTSARNDPNGLRVDLGTDTGPFHGGAAGSLYGLYGPGVPSSNIIEGMNLRTVATKAQDGAQHPGSDALEVVGPLAEATDGDLYLRVTDYYRGFPYRWPGDTPGEKLADFARVLDGQLRMIETLPPDHRDNLVVEPFNEPEGNMFGTGEWSLDGTSWLDDPTAFFAAWDETYRTIRSALPDTRIAGPGTSILYDQVEGFLEHVVEAGTVPDIISWHELSHPRKIRDSVARYRDWEAAAFAGTELEGARLPVNINEYAFNYHTSVPGQMIQWISALEDSKVDGMIAFWNVGGNLSDSAVDAGRANGQWWLYNAYGQMSGHTVRMTPPFGGENYTLQGVATLDEERRLARTLFGGADGRMSVELANVPRDVFGDAVRVVVREIPWTGQLGDSPQPRHVDQLTLPVTGDGTVAVSFDDGTLPPLKESSAYEVLVTPAGVSSDDGAAADSRANSGTTADAGPVSPAPPALWSGSHEAEDASHTGDGYSLGGPEGSPDAVDKFHTSGGYHVGGLRTGSDVVLDVEVDVPHDGTYDLSVFASSLNTHDAVAEQGPTNIFVRVDGANEQELHLPLGYKWVVWDHADTTVELTAGTHTISLAARSLDGTGATRGDAIVDRVTLSLPHPDAATSVYEAEFSDHDGRALYGTDEIVEGLGAGADRGDRTSPPGHSGGAVELRGGQAATFWVYGAVDGEATLRAVVVGDGTGTVTVNGHDVLDLDGSRSAAVHLVGGVNKVTVTGRGSGLVLDRLTVGPGGDRLEVTELSANDAELAGAASVIELSLADDGLAVDGIGGEPGNDNTLTFRVSVPADGTYAMVVRYANPEWSQGSHYNPNPLARRADIGVNDGAAKPVLFPTTFHRNAFTELTVPLTLTAGENTIRFSSHEAPNWNGDSFAGDLWPGILLRSSQAPIVDRIRISPLVEPLT